jgi:hypothetical protein
MMRNAIITVGWHQLTGQTATIDDVVSRLERYSVRQIVGFVGRITVVLAHESRENGAQSAWDRQVHIASGFLGPNGGRSLVDLARGREGSAFDPEHRAFFHERQTLNALKVALIVVDADKPDDPTPSLVPFVEALFMLNDLIEPQEGSMGPATVDGQHAMELYIAANTLFNESPAVLSDFVRAHYLYVEARPEISVPGSVDVPAALAKAMGMDAVSGWCALFALYGNWATTSVSDVDGGRITANRREYLANLRTLSGACDLSAAAT